MQNGQVPTPEQEILINKSGLFHTDWLVRHEDENYLHLVAKNKCPSEIKIVEKIKRKVLAPASNQD